MLSENLWIPEIARIGISLGLSACSAQRFSFFVFDCIRDQELTMEEFKLFYTETAKNWI